MNRYASPRSPAGRPANDPLAQQLPLVSGKWLLFWLSGIFGGGLVLVYLTLCLLFWQGQWQILFQRTQPVAVSAASLPGTREQVLFDTSESGKPRLGGIFITPPATQPATSRTILYLPDPSSTGQEKTLQDLHFLAEANVRIFAFDYRGVVTGQPQHPSEISTTEDAEAAWQYLTGTRHTLPASIVFYGAGLGASLAARLAASHPEAAGLVMDQPSAPALDLFNADARSRWMPVRLLTHDRFDPTTSLRTATQPKLFLLPAGAPASVRLYAQLATPPKLIVDLSGTAAATNTTRQAAFRRFLNTLSGPNP